MKAFTFLAYFFVIRVIFWLVEVGIVSLEDKCEAEKPRFTDRILSTILEFFGRPPPEAPWWNPLCKLTSPDMTKNLKSLYNYLVFCMVVTFCFGSVQIRKPVRGKDSHKEKLEKKLNKEKPTLSDAAPVSKRAQNLVVSKRTDIQKTDPLLHLFWSLADVGFKEPVIPDSVKRSCSYSSIFGYRKRQQTPLITVLENMKFQFTDRNNSSIPCMTVVDRIEEIIRPSNPVKQAGRFDKALLGPVAVCLQALSHVVAATFRSFNIPNTDIKWSTEKDYYGGPAKITATSPTMMAEITPSEITIYRVTGVQGLLRSVSFQTYLVTYNGLVCKEDATTCMCGPGWNL